MKTFFKIFFVVYMLLCNSTIVSSMATEWEVVGPKGFANEGLASGSIVVNSRGVPYVAYADNNTGRPVVMKFTGTVWASVSGTEISTRMTSDISIAIDGSDTIFILYGDGENALRTTVKKLPRTANVWETVGLPGFSGGQITSSATTSIAVDGSGIPFVAYLDTAHANKATVMKFDTPGNTWNVVGTVGFSSGLASDIDIALDSSSTPYVVYQNVDVDANTPDKATVMKFNGAVWDFVGPAGVSAGYAWDTNIAIDSLNVPYIAFRDLDIGEKATVMKFAGGVWSYVGNRGFSTSFAPYLSLALDADNTPYVAFSDHGSSPWKATTMEFNGSGWVNVGSPGFSDGTVDNTDIAVGAGVIYVLYEDYTAANHLTVMKFGDIVNPVTTAPALSILLND